MVQNGSRLATQSSPHCLSMVLDLCGQVVCESESGGAGRLKKAGNYFQCVTGEMLSMCVGVSILCIFELFSFIYLCFLQFC